MHNIGLKTRLKRRLCFIPVVLAGASLAGCMVPVEKGQSSANRDRQAADTSPPPAVANIVQIWKVFTNVPWLIFDQSGAGKVDGFKCTLYLLAPVTDEFGAPLLNDDGSQRVEGRFGTGIIRVEMHELLTDQRGQIVAKPVYEWELNEEEAMPWRCRTRTALGWGYGLRLNWGSKVDVADKQVAVIIKYIREDGRVIGTKRKVLLVPARNVY